VEVRLVGLDSGSFSDLAEPGDFALDVGGEMLRRAGATSSPWAPSVAPTSALPKHLHGFGVQPADDRAGFSWASNPKMDHNIQEINLVTF